MIHFLLGLHKSPVHGQQTLSLLQVHTKMFQWLWRHGDDCQILMELVYFPIISQTSKSIYIMDILEYLNLFSVYSVNNFAFTTFVRCIRNCDGLAPSTVSVDAFLQVFWWCFLKVQITEDTFLRYWCFASKRIQDKWTSRPYFSISTKVH